MKNMISSIYGTLAAKAATILLLVALFAVFATVACGKSSPTNHQEALLGPTSTSAVTLTPTAATPPLSATAPPAPHVQILCCEPHLYATAALEQRIFWADAVVRVSFKSVTADAQTFYENKGAAATYRPVQRLQFDVKEYLKGTGASSVSVLAVLGSNTYATKAEAQKVASDSLSTRTTTWDNREGIIFLNTPSNSAPWSSSTWADAVAISANTKEFIFTPTAGESGEYAIDTPNRVWLPAKEADGASGSSGDARVFLVSGMGEDGSYPEMSLVALRAQVSASVADLEANKQVQGYKECINKKLDYERYYRGVKIAQGAWKPSVVEDGIASGIAQGHEIGKESYSSRWGIYSQFWHTGRDADMFTALTIDADKSPDNGYSYVMATVRPLPAGTYKFFSHVRLYSDIPCNFRPTRNYIEQTVTVTAPTDAIHEAFFDPVNVGKTVAADATNGVLKPTNFTVSGSSATLTKIAWEDGKTTMEFQPPVSLAGHHADFIGLDGKVALRLDFDDAKVTTSGTKRTFEWGVCKQPWVSGDLLMLRMSKSGETLTGVTNDRAAP